MQTIESEPTATRRGSIPKYALIYGAFAGAIAAAAITLGLVLAPDGGATHSMWFGYLLMLVALTFVFVGTKRYRDVECGGIVGFGRAFAVGLGIAVVAGVAYVIVWESYLAISGYQFMDQYIASIVRERQASGITGAALAAEVAELEKMRVQYDNPLIRLPMTFMEIFPVGLIVALVSSAVLRNPRMLPARR